MKLKSVSVVAISLIASTSMASQFKNTGVNRCSTKDHKGQYESIAVKIAADDKSKVLLVGVTFDGYVDVVTGTVLSRKTFTSSAGVHVVKTAARLEDGSSLKAVEFGDTDASAERS